MKSLQTVGALGLLLVSCLSTADANAQWPGLASKNNPSRPDPEQETEPEVERLGAERLRQRLPDLRTRAEPRVWQGTVGFGSRLVYVLLDVEGSLDVYPAPWLRLGFIYAAGVGTAWDGRQTTATFAQYGEGMVGLRLWSTRTQVDVDLQLRRSVGNYGQALPGWARPRNGDFAEVLPVWLPSSHHLFIEGGALTGHVGLKQCSANCEPNAPDLPTYSALSRQLVIPFAGLRYVYYSEALNARPHVDRVRNVDVYVHALLHAFNKPSVQGYYPNGTEAHGAAVGVRVGADLPFSPFCLGALAGLGCAQPGLSVGYAPYPAFLTGSVTIRIPIY